MSKRIIFVGMNNKPGLAPLCSSTKSGKLIDRIITELPQYEFIKSNLYNLDYWPHDVSVNYHDWSDRVQYDPNKDVIVALGQCVRDRFKTTQLKFVGIGHPSAVWSNEGKKKYVKEAIEKIESTN